MVRGVRNEEPGALHVFSEHIYMPKVQILADHNDKGRPHLNACMKLS